jgi:histidinol-phosphatase (PHP family)
MIDILSDGHVHTRLCNHAEGEMEEYVLAAISRGLRKIVFLEHMETGVSYFMTTWLSEEDFDYYCAEGGRLKEKYRDTITVGIGVELGYNPECSEEILARVSQRQWDRIGISYHFCRLPGLPDHLNLLSRKGENLAIATRYGTDAILNSYFDNLREAVLYLPGTVLCHLDAALRYTDNLVLTPGHLEKIDKLLLAVKLRGMALEINTSGIPIRGEPFPRRALLQRALHYDIPLVAGSDAHRPQEVGRYFDSLQDYITSALSS